MVGFFFLFGARVSSWTNILMGLKLIEWFTEIDKFHKIHKQCGVAFFLHQIMQQWHRNQIGAIRSIAHDVIQNACWISISAKWILSDGVLFQAQNHDRPQIKEL